VGTKVRTRTRRLSFSEMQPTWVGALLAGMLATSSVGAAARPEDPPPMLVVLGLDTSGSIGNASLTRAKDLVPALLASLPAGTELAVITFDDQPHVVVPPTSSPGRIAHGLEGVQVAGRFTALHDAVFDASRYAREAPAARKAIVLVTDGVDDNSALDLDDGLKAAREAQIPVFTIGVGGHPRQHVLRRIAKLTGGEYTPFEHVRVAELATRIASTPPVPTEGRLTKGGTPRSGPASASPTPRTGRGRLFAWGLALLGTLAAGVLVMVRRAHGAVVRVPAPSPVPALLPGAPADVLPPPVNPALSPTVLARMNQTEEYLERTITLLERPVLAVTRGTRAGEVFELSASAALSIGRSRVNDIQIDDVSVSAQHCRVRPEDGRFVLHDLRSTNGTLVNERRVPGRHVLEEGDVITIGETAIQYRREMTRSSPAA